MSAETASIEAEYTAQRPVFEAFTKNALDLIQRLLDGEGIEVAALESRTKSIESLREKLERGDKIGKYDSLSDITDLSGLRVISFLKEDCENISNLMRKNFLIDDKNTTFKENELDPDRFGYQSIHLILSYNSDRLKLPEFKRFSNLKFELQVKTLLQHTWSAIDWKLRYKKSTEAPKKLRRRLFRISALLDAADDELSYVYDQVSDIKKYYQSSLEKGDLSLEIDKESVFAYINYVASNGRIIDKAYSKFAPIPSRTGKTDTTETSSDKLYGTIKRLNISSIKELDKKVQNIKDSDIEAVSKSVSDWLASATLKSWSSNPFDITRLCLIAGMEKSLAREILDTFPFNPALTKSLKKVLGISAQEPEIAPLEMSEQISPSAPP